MVLQQITVINCITNDIILQMTGKMSISTSSKNRLDIVVENEDESYSDYMVGLNDHVIYVIANIETTYVEKYHFTIDYNPKMWIPVKKKI